MNYRVRSYLPFATGIIIVLAIISSGVWLTRSHRHTVSSSTPTLKVVAGENFWGSLASQLGGTKVTVTSIVSDPNADPHEYESNVSDAEAIAQANYVILNGAGYDSWGDKLLAASPNSHRTVLTVATLLSKQEGDNPHFWYNPTYVYQVINQITADYITQDPANTSYYQQQHTLVENSLTPYRTRLTYIQTHFAGTKVAATEDIFAYLASYTKLDLISPPAFMQAVAEGNDPPAQSVVTFEQQLSNHEPQVLVYNLQTATAVTTTIKEQAASQNIPVIGVTETIQPPTATFQEWMDGQLDALTNALNAQLLAQ